MSISFIEKLKTIFELVKEPSTLSAILSLKHSGYLIDVGWFNSFKSGSSVGKDNEPIPWVTYPFIDFLASRLKTEFEIFEFGSGNSTLYFSQRVKTVTAVEHDKHWFNLQIKRNPGNVKLIFESFNDSDNYSSAINYSNQNYDIVFIDGLDRVNCIRNSIGHLKNDGVLILDDSDRIEYSEAFVLMKEKGFSNLDFWGISPGYLNRKATTVFYRKPNCLEI